NNLTKLLASLRKIDIHFLRKENQLFPHLENIDISGPSQVMWALDDDIRAMLKKAEKELNDKNGESFMSSV
ncbi:MAG: hemerythrin domain-containing protein, partial [Desulfobacter sp.]|nr:hemerythrin domain-containing protein [Desulfobacter sp.]